MFSKIILGVALAIQSIAVAGPTAVNAEECLGSCQASPSDSTSFAPVKKKWYCMAKDGCGKTYIPDCGNPCFDHAVSDAIRECDEATTDEGTCEVVSPKEDGTGSCSRDRELLVLKAGPKPPKN